MTPKQFLEDTIAYYSVNPQERRCKNYRGMCSYSPRTVEKEGKSEGCAIGRHLSPEAQEQWDTYDDNDSVIGMKNRTELFASTAPEWMQTMNERFLRDVQRMHDVDGYWNENGLSAEGLEKVDLIKKEYASILN